MKELLSYITGNKKISIRNQCELMDISRSNVYYQSVGESEENLQFMRLMDEHYLDHPTYGVLQMQDFLLLLGFLVNVKRVRRLLRKMGLMAIYPKRNLSKLGSAKYIRPYLLRGLKAERPNQVWALEGHGAAYSLREMLTIKSDDIMGRSQTFDAIIKGQQIGEPNVPASFNVLLNYLRGLSLDVELKKSNK